MTTPLFPLVRHLSPPLTGLLLRTPATPNQITFLAIAFGLAAAAALLLGTQWGDLACGALLTVSYVLDNCDGEVARAKKLSSNFGAYFDSLGDWVVHATLFAAMGIGGWERTGEDWWLWVGIVAAAGTTINSAIAIPEELRKLAAPRATAPAQSAEYRRPAQGDPLGKWLIFFFRELARADFCFIVLALAALDWLIYVLPLAAIGAQVYWISYFVVREEKYHV